MDDASVFFTSGGGESIETAVKLVRRYWSLIGRAGADDRHLARARLPRPRRLRHEHRRDRRRSPSALGPLAGGTLRVPWDDADALAAAIDEVGADRVAAFFCEPIIGAGGVLLPPEGYLPDACARSAATARCSSSPTR